MNALSRTFQIVVDYNRPMVEMKEDGRYGMVHNGIIAENFPTEQTGIESVTVELFYFGPEATYKNVLAEMEGNGYRPATIYELLAFGAQHSGVQGRFTILALGSVWEEYSDADVRVVPMLGSDSRRYLNLWHGVKYLDCFCFLAVRKAA